jgi:hypothetical protein
VLTAGVALDHEGDATGEVRLARLSEVPERSKLIGDGAQAVTPARFRRPPGEPFGCGDSSRKGVCVGFYRGVGPGVITEGDHAKTPSMMEAVWGFVTWASPLRECNG